MQLRKARNSDVGQIRSLINDMAARTDEDHKHGHMLPRSLVELYEHIRDYTVLVDADNQVLGCCALQSSWDGLAELKALAVDDSLQGQGWGRKLVEAALSEADDLGIDCVFTLTNKHQFFERLRFEIIDMRPLAPTRLERMHQLREIHGRLRRSGNDVLGTQPRQTFIPAIGIHANAAAQAALGLVPSQRGPMNSNGFRPPFAPHGNDE